MVLTVLVSESYVEDARDDSAFLETTRAVLSRIQADTGVPNPVNPTENLAKHRFDQMTSLEGRLEQLVTEGDRAHATANPKEACEIWALQFGDRFPSCGSLPASESVKKTSSPAILHGDGRSAK